MNFDIKTSLLLLIGSFIQTSYQLDCLQCTTPILLSSNEDHSCLKGTLRPLGCLQTGNETEEYPQCVSSVYRLGQQGIGGIVIDRRCVYGREFLHDCHPPISFIDFTKSDQFYCSYNCSDDGCNRQSVEVITFYALTSNGISFLKVNPHMVSIFVSYLIYRCYSS